MAELQSILSQWKEGLEKEAPLPKYQAFLLEHQYTDASLCYESLKGHDQQVAAHRREACDGSFCFYLANLERSVMGGVDEFYGDHDDYGYERGEREDGGFHDILEEIDKTSVLQRIVDLDGTLLTRNLEFDEDNFVQADPFENEPPDDEEYSGFTGNEGVSATHFYNRTASSSKGIKLPF